jgi:hypothetical protein
MRHGDLGWSTCDWCNLIAKVREDERQKTFDADWSEMGQLAAVRLFCKAAERNMLAKCIEVVREGYYVRGHDPSEMLNSLPNLLANLEALGEQQ